MSLAGPFPEGLTLFPPCRQNTKKEKIGKERTSYYYIASSFFIFRVWKRKKIETNDFGFSSGPFTLRMHMPVSREMYYILCNMYIIFMSMFNIMYTFFFTERAPKRRPTIRAHFHGLYPHGMIVRFCVRAIMSYDVQWNLPQRAPSDQTTNCLQTEPSV